MWEDSLIVGKIKDQKNLIFVLLLYLFFAIILFSHYKYIINSDGIVYISIAKHYLNGRISYAINGYWSPLFSWLLIPFIYFWPGNLGNIVSTKVLSIILGLFTFVAVYLILTRLILNNRIKTVILLAFIPIILYFTFNLITPDLLVVCLLLYYLNFLMDEKYRKMRYMGLLTGFLGALAFLAKTYVFFFLIIHFVLTSFFYIKNFPLDRETVQKNLLLGLSIFLIISGVWAGIISEKYGTLTIGTSGSYNYALVGPESSGHIMFYQGLIKPPNEYSVSSWEDPSYFPIKKWNPLKSTKNLNHQIAIILGNIYSITLISLNLLLIPLFAILMALFLLFKSKERSTKYNTVFILGTMILYSGGYLLLLIEERYLWLVIILSFILGFYSLNRLYREKFIKKNIFKLIFIILTIFLAFYPTFSLYSYSEACSGFYEVSLDLKSHEIKGNIASNDHWEIMDYFAYYLNSKFYGVTGTQSEVDLKDELVQNKIDYYFIWGESPSNSLGEIVYENIYFKVVKVSI